MHIDTKWVRNDSRQDLLHTTERHIKLFTLNSVDDIIPNEKEVVHECCVAPQHFIISRSGLNHEFTK